MQQEREGGEAGISTERYNLVGVVLRSPPSTGFAVPCWAPQKNFRACKSFIYEPAHTSRTSVFAQQTQRERQLA